MKIGQVFKIPTLHNNLKKYIHIYIPGNQSAPFLKRKDHFKIATVNVKVHVILLIPTSHSFSKITGQ